MRLLSSASFFFFFNDTATTEIYTLSLHDALPISGFCGRDPWRAPQIHDLHRRQRARPHAIRQRDGDEPLVRDRKSTRLNSSHLVISYAVFCLKKKKTTPAGTAPQARCAFSALTTA